tara:strand:+ start:17988 stop:18542 length:555 start_codon:yes stop_codon:yes gene_type:complete
MDIESTNIEGVFIVRPKVFKDKRGYFTELYSQRGYCSEIFDKESVQFNFSHSSSNVLRGLHYQRTKPQGKLVQVLKGKIFDVGVDIRKNSPTFGEHFSLIFSDQDHIQIYFPPGIAHGFCVLSEYADVTYQCTDYYYPDDEGGLLWNDPDLNIDWPIDDPIVSEKDQIFKRLIEFRDDEYPIAQ